MNKTVEQQAGEDSSVNKLLQLERETERSLEHMDRLFGTLGSQEYDNYKHYLKGIQSAIRTTMRLLDI